MRVASLACSIAILLAGCEELGNPATGESTTVVTPWTEWTGAYVRTRTRLQSFRVPPDLPAFLARLRADELQLVESTIRPGGFAGLVTVDVIDAKGMRFGPMATEIELANGPVVIKLWTPPPTNPPWQILVALDAPARTAITHPR
jgi:hypothetical protein